MSEQPAVTDPLLDTAWWTLTPEEAVEKLQTDPIRGLSRAAAEKQTARFGDNSLPEEEQEGLLQSLINAFKDPLALVLTIAAAASAIIGLIEGNPTELQQAMWIMGIVVFMTLVGFYTDYFSNQEMEKLKKLQVEKTTVIRDGERLIIEAQRLVPGDIILLGQGDKVPADGRILEAVNTTADEQIFTGEPRDMDKNAGRVLTADTPLAERNNMVLGGSFIMSGNLTATVTATGVNSELGKIWKDLNKTEDVLTPLQEQLENLGKMLLYGTLVVCLLVIFIYVAFQNYPLQDAVIVAVALAIAFIPEALGAIILIALALGAREMVSKQTIIREKYAAEGLGSVSIICTDKTGTITYGKMTVTHFWEPTTGSHRIEDQNWTHISPELSRLLDVARYTNNLKDPTDEALGRLVAKASRPITPDLRVYRKSEVPFSSFRKRMSTLDEIPDQPPTMHLKGAPSLILPLCSNIYDNGTLRPLVVEDQVKINAQMAAYESEGYRVLALANKAWDEPVRDLTGEDENNMTFLGMVAISDPPRHEVIDTIKTLRRAGIDVKMITGDSPLTAMSIAREIGLITPTAERSVAVLESHELQKMIAATGDPNITDAEKFTAEQINRIVEASIFSRVTPMDKKILISALQRAGHLVSMVGDGVNDALAIKQSNVGIAMSTGTELAKAVSRAVLTGSYEALTSAVQVGRTILYRARLYIHALLSTNGAEVGMFIVAAIMGWSPPLTAIQLLVINLLGDSWLSIALATEAAEKDVMEKPPRPADEPVIIPYMWFSIGLQSVVATIIMIIAFLTARNETAAMGLDINGDEALAIQQTAVFIAFMAQKILRSAFTARSLRYNIWEIGFFTNKWSLIAAVVTLAIALLAIYVLPVGMTPVPGTILPTLLVIGLIPPIVEEGVKFALKFRSSPNPQQPISVQSAS